MFRQTIRSELALDNILFGAHYQQGSHSCLTVIYALISERNFSAMHRLLTEEIWFFHFGDPLEMLMLHPDGRAKSVILGQEISNAEKVQHTVPKNVWQGSTPLANNHGYSLVSAVMVPGFEWPDFELGERDKLVTQYPDHDAIIRLTRSTPMKGKL